MYILSADNIEKAAPPHLWTDVMELALKAISDPDYYTPERMHIEMGDNSLFIMPAIGPDMFATKMLSVFPNNGDQNHNVVNGQLVLSEERTGEPIAFFNGAKLAAMRTAAVGAVGIRHLADPLASTLGIIGAGVQARHLALFAVEERDFERVFVYDTSFKAVQEFIGFLQERKPDLDVAICEDAMQVASHSEVVITATTSSEPVLPNLEDLLLGKTYISVGSYKSDMQELPEAIFRLIDQIWIDTYSAKEESGDVIFALESGMVKPEKIKHISDLINAPDAITFRDTRLFKTIGSGILDLFAAKLVYERARELGIGQEVEL